MATSIKGKPVKGYSRSAGVCPNLITKMEFEALMEQDKHKTSLQHGHLFILGRKDRNTKVSLSAPNGYYIMNRVNTLDNKLKYPALPVCLPENYKNHDGDSRPFAEQAQDFLVAIRVNLYPNISFHHHDRLGYNP